MKGARILIIVVWAVLGAVPARSATDPATLLARQVPAGIEPTVPAVLWNIAADDVFADAFLGGVDSTGLALADTLISFLRLPEPAMRKQLPELYRISDFGPPPEERPPAWADVRWAGVRWMRALLEFGPTGRDRRVREELDARMGTVGRPQRAEMGGLVAVLELWWADRGLDPALTHREVPRDPAQQKLDELLHHRPGPGTHRGLQLLVEMDHDPVLRERVLGRLDVDTWAFLCRDFMIPLQVGVDSLVTLGVPAPAWDPDLGLVVGSSLHSLRRLALDALDQASGEVLIAGGGAAPRSLARVAWWDSARYQARFHDDPSEAPDFSIFLLGLRRPESEGGRSLMPWLRLVYMQSPVIRDRILEQMGDYGEPMAAELVGLLFVSRDRAAREGFRMVYTRRPLIAAEGLQPVTVAIDWSEVQGLVRELLGAVTGERPPSGVEDPASANAWWRDWWAAGRDDSRWYRGELPGYLTLEPGPVQPGFKTRSGRVD